MRSPTDLARLRNIISDDTQAASLSTAGRIARADKAEPLDLALMAKSRDVLAKSRGLLARLRD